MAKWWNLGSVPRYPYCSICSHNGKCCTIKYYVRKIQNPWILGKHEIQYFIVLYFPFYFIFRQKISVVLNCTLRSEKGAERPHNRRRSRSYHPRHDLPQRAHLPLPPRRRGRVRGAAAGGGGARCRPRGPPHLCARLQLRGPRCGPARVPGLWAFGQRSRARRGFLRASIPGFKLPRELWHRLVHGDAQLHPRPRRVRRDHDHRPGGRRGQVMPRGEMRCRARCKLPLQGCESGKKEL